MSSNIDTPPITPQQYEILHGGGAEAAEIAQQRLSRRRFLRRSMLAVCGLSTTAAASDASTPRASVRGAGGRKRFEFRG